MSDFTERKERNKQVIVLAMVKALEHLRAAEAKLGTAATLCGYGSVTLDIRKAATGVTEAMESTRLATRYVRSAEAVHM